VRDLLQAHERALAALAWRVAPPGTVEVGEQMGLPLLPPSEIVLYARLADPRSRGALRAISAAFRNSPAR
jgi:hypothetical protein